MNDKDMQNEQLESILRRAHVPEPSPELKERITAEAAKAWNQTSLELPWQIPVRRLIVSAAAAVLVIWLANCSSDYAVARWQSGGLPVVHQQPSDLDELPEEIMVNVEEDYQVCARMLARGAGGTKKKAKRGWRKKSETDR